MNDDHPTCSGEEDHPLPPWFPHYQNQLMISSWIQYDGLVLLLDCILVWSYWNRDFEKIIGISVNFFFFIELILLRMPYACMHAYRLIIMVLIKIYLCCIFLIANISFLLIKERVKKQKKELYFDVALCDTNQFLENLWSIEKMFSSISRIISESCSCHRTIKNYCQALPQLQLQLWLRLVLVSIPPKPSGHPPTSSNK